MPRPFVYKHLDRTILPGDHRETIALGYGEMWGVKKGDQWVTVCKEDAYKIDPSSSLRKYTRLFFANKKSAQTQCNKFNRIFNTQDYQVEKI